MRLVIGEFHTQQAMSDSQMMPGQILAWQDMVLPKVRRQGWRSGQGKASEESAIPVFHTPWNRGLRNLADPSSS